MTLTKMTFKIALAVAGISLSEYARQRKVSDPMIHMILSGKSTSKKHRSHMQRFMDEKFKELRIVDHDHKLAA